MTRKGRRLRPEEEELWLKITKSTKPLDTRNLPHKAPVPKKAGTQDVRTPPISPFRVGELSNSPKPATRISPPDQPLRMDRKTYGRMRQGKSAPEARIDLHGMTVDVAHSALRAFLLRCHADRKRLVLVITGKGRSDDLMGMSDGGRGVLRRQVPHWLELPPLRQIVLQTATAHQKHGGSGALYVYLRR